MAGALDNIPFYSAYIQRNAQNEQAGQAAERNTFANAGALAQLQAQVVARQHAAQMQPLQIQQLQQQLEAQKVAAAEAARKAAFYSPENRAQFMTPGTVTPPATPNDDNGNPNPSVQGAPTLDFNRLLRSAAEQGIVNPETYANHQAQREQARATQEATAQSRRDSLEARYAEIDRQSRRDDITDQTRRDLARQADQTKRELAALIASGRDTPHPVIGVNDAGNQVVNFVRPSQGGTTLETKPVGAANVQARIDNSRASQIQSRYSTATKPTLESLNSTEMYRQFRAEGDFAQAGTMAAEALRRAARGGSTRFKGEAAGLLGSGYGSGNLADRLENFISQEFSKGGGPTKDTLAKIDKLVGAADEANFQNLARTTKFFAAQVQGQQGMKLRNAIGAPFVSGQNVVFPDGTYARFPDGKAADNAAQKWLEANQ